jgi:hypothetical protein
MNAGDAFGLEIKGRTTVQDGREVVVYTDGAYTHAVCAEHYDNCGFKPSDDAEEQAANYDLWNMASDHWVDDLTAIEAAWRLNVFTIHSADGSCSSLDSDTHGACLSVAGAHRGEHYTSPAFRLDADRVNWDGLWPVVNRDGELTGAITEGDDHYNVDDAMIEAEEARDGGWEIDSDGGSARPPRPIPPARCRWIETGEQADEFLETHQSVRLDYRRTREGWVAVIHGTNVRPLPHGPRKLRDLERTLAHRYLAETFGDHATVHLKWARGMPNWANNNGLGALPELARAIEQAEREQQKAAAV